MGTRARVDCWWLDGGETCTLYEERCPHPNALLLLDDYNWEGLKPQDDLAFKLGQCEPVGES